VSFGIGFLLWDRFAHSGAIGKLPVTGNTYFPILCAIKTHLARKRRNFLLPVQNHRAPFGIE
jgi:hypothetical protein